MVEAYLGSIEDCHFIRGYLKNIRMLRPVEWFTLPHAISLEEALLTRTTDAPLIDGDLFQRLVNSAIQVLRAEYFVEIVLLNPKRYFFGIPTGSRAIGGFHSKWSVGYHQLYHAGFVVALNPERVQDIIVRTAEAARSYLHDCLHHSTFRSYRRAVTKPRTRAEAKRCEPRVYREQYGFNFRNSEGMSYSSIDITALVPKAINLNLLMDGIVVIVVASIISRESAPINLNKFDKGVLYEVIGKPFKVPDYEHAQTFHYGVTKPSQAFISHWGGDAFLRLALTAMMTGELDPLKSYFNRRYGEEGAWEKVFRRPDFNLG
jgi:hypothetical protein